MRSMSRGVSIGVCFFMSFVGFLYAPVFALENRVSTIVGGLDSNIPDEMALYQQTAEKYKNDGENEIVLKSGVVFHPYGYEITYGVLWLMFKGQASEPKQFETGLVVSLLDVETINQEKPDPVEANFGMATFYLNEGKDFYKAIGYLEEALTLDPKHELALIDLGSAYNHVGRFVDSLRMGQKAVELYPENKKLWFNLAVAYEKEDQFSKAEESYDKAIALDPDFGEAYANLGMFFLTQGWMEEAKTKLNAAKRLLVKAENAQILDTIEKVLVEIEGREGVNRGLEMAAAGQYKEARVSFEQDLSQGQADFQRDYCVIVLNDLDQGIVPAEYGKYFFQGLIEHRRPDYQKAIGEFEKAIAIDDNVPHAQFFLGVAYVSLEQLEKAVPYFEDAISLKPDFVEAYWGLASVYEILGEAGLARKNYEQARAIFVERKNDQVVKIIDEHLSELSK